MVEENFSSQNFDRKFRGCEEFFSQLSTISNFIINITHTSLSKQKGKMGVEDPVINPYSLAPVIEENIFSNEHVGDGVPQRVSYPPIADIEVDSRSFSPKIMSVSYQNPAPMPMPMHSVPRGSSPPSSYYYYDPNFGQHSRAYIHVRKDDDDEASTLRCKMACTMVLAVLLFCLFSIFFLLSFGGTALSLWITNTDSNWLDYSTAYQQNGLQYIYRSSLYPQQYNYTKIILPPQPSPGNYSRYTLCYEGGVDTVVLATNSYIPLFYEVVEDSGYLIQVPNCNSRSQLQFYICEHSAPYVWVQTYNSGSFGLSSFALQGNYQTSSGYCSNSMLDNIRLSLFTFSIVVTLLSILLCCCCFSCCCCFCRYRGKLQNP